MRFSFGLCLNRLIFKLMTSAIFVAGSSAFLIPCGKEKETFMDFTTSIGVLLLCGLLLGSICSKLRLPSLVGMLIVGIVLSPYALNLLSPELLDISADLRQLALIIILTRAGLSFDLNELKKNGRSAILFCFVPALCEIVGYVIFGNWLLGLSVKDSAIMGCVMAAVSPAVIVPRMLKLKEQGYGTDKGVPQMIMAGASADDIFVIVLFTSLITLPSDKGFDLGILWKTPCSIVTGIGVGLLFGWLFAKFFQKVHIRDSIKVVLLICFSIFFVSVEDLIAHIVPFSGLLAVIAMCAMLYKNHPVCAKRLSLKYNKLWIVAEIFLFVLVGAAVDVQYALKSGAVILAVMALAMLLRLLGVWLCVLGTRLNAKERLFCMIAYIPKATAQAAIGAIPLTMGLACGQIILTAAVISILVTAPIGAFLIDVLYKKLLIKSASQH